MACKTPEFHFNPAWPARQSSAVMAAVFSLFLLVSGQARGQDLLTQPAKPAGKAVVVPGASPEERTVRVEQPTGKISMDDGVSDIQLEKMLNSILKRYPGAEKSQAVVSTGVATLKGQVRSDEVVTSLGEFVKQVEGVRLVINELESLEARESPFARLVWQFHLMFLWLRRWWLSLVVALLMITLALWVNSLIRLYGQSLMTHERPISLSKTLLISIISRIVPTIGFLLAMILMDWTGPLFSFFGAAGIFGLSLGFAFQQVGDNFISSLLLGMRRPFQVGDYVEIAGYSGFVKSLNSRATNIVTLDSHLVRIPNSMIYKSILVNQTASPIRRETIAVKLTSYQTAVAKAQSLMTSAMLRHPAVLSNPTPCVLITDLLPDGIELKCYYWIASVNVDRWLLASQLRLSFKVALNEAGIPMDGSAGVSAVSVSFEQPVPPLGQAQAQEQPAATPPVTEKPRDPDAEAVQGMAMSSEALTDETSDFIQRQIRMLEERETFLSGNARPIAKIARRSIFE